MYNTISLGGVILFRIIGNMCFYIRICLICTLDDGYIYACYILCLAVHLNVLIKF